MDLKAGDAVRQRVQKLMAQAGLCSRRTAEQWMLDGRVTVNGLPARPGEQADPECDCIEVDGKPLTGDGEKVYLMLNKPRGYVTTLSDEKGRKNVTQLVSGCGVRVWPVGRLDMDSEGLLLLTDDGAVTQRLTHPRHGMEKEYLVWVTGDAQQAAPILRRPMTLDGGEQVNGAQVKVGPEKDGVTRLSVVIRQGKNRQVRRMCAGAGLKVLRLKRVSEGGVLLDRFLAPGQWRPLTEEELERLRSDGGGA